MNDSDICNKAPIGSHLESHRTEINNIVEAINELREAEHNLQEFTLGLFTSESKTVEVSLPDLNTFQDIWEYLPDFIDQINKGIQSWSSRIYDLVIGRETVIGEGNVAQEAELSNKVIIISESIETLRKTVDSCLRGLIDSMGIIYNVDPQDPSVAKEVVFGNVWPFISSDLCVIAADIIRYKNIIGEVIYNNNKIQCEKKG